MMLRRSCRAATREPALADGSMAVGLLSPTRAGRNASTITDAVIAHLSGQTGADVKMTLEIEANIPDGAPEQVARAVTENSRTLKFEVSGFLANIDTIPSR